MSEKAWGFLGKPPKSVMDGSTDKMQLFRSYQSDVAKAQKLKNKRARAVTLASIKAKYQRDFPPEE